MAIPIIIVHQGNEEYLHYSLQQAKVSNPNSDVILIGRAINQTFATNAIKHVFIESFHYTALEFSKVFKNIGDVHSGFNLFCFQRWFIIRDFMAANHLPQCCCLDSDVLLYSDINHIEYGSVQTPWTCIFTIDDLNHFCTLVMNYFSHHHLLQNLYRFVFEEIKHPFITDMELFMCFNHQKNFLENPYKLGHFEDYFFDQNINQQIPFYEMLEEKKKIYYMNGNFYCKEPNTHQYVRVCSLHFQGAAKHYINHFFLPHVHSSAILYFNYNSLQWLESS